MNKDPQRFTRTPYFENPVWFTKPVIDKDTGREMKPAQNFYYKPGNRNAGENHVFILEEDIETQGEESAVVFKPNQTFCLFFEENPDNRFGRQYVETTDGKFYDLNSGLKLIIGGRFKSSKVARTIDFEEFCMYLSANKHNKVLKQLLTKIED